MNWLLMDLLFYVLVGAGLFGIALLLKKWKLLPLFLPNVMKPAILRATPIYYGLDGTEIPNPKLSKIQKEALIKYDLQADTTATILPKLVVIDKTSKPSTDLLQPMVKTEATISEAIYKAWCSKCRVKHDIKNVNIINVKSRKGIKRYAQGQCAECNTNISLMIKVN